MTASIHHAPASRGERGHANTHRARDRWRTAQRQALDFTRSRLYPSAGWWCAALRGRRSTGGVEELREATEHQLAVHPLGIGGSAAQKILNRFLVGCADQILPSRLGSYPLLPGVFDFEGTIHTRGRAREAPPVSDSRGLELGQPPDRLEHAPQVPPSSKSTSRRHTYFGNRHKLFHARPAAVQGTRSTTFAGRYEI